jgi:hypothetical protein
MTDQQPQNVTQAATQVGNRAIEAMTSVPLAIALLIVNAAFLGFSGYVLGIVGKNAAERNNTQMELIHNLVKDCLKESKSSNVHIHPRSYVFKPIGDKQ